MAETSKHGMHGRQWARIGKDHEDHQVVPEVPEPPFASDEREVRPRKRSRTSGTHKAGRGPQVRRGLVTQQPQQKNEPNKHS